MQLTAFCYLSMNTSAIGVVTLAPDLNVNLVRIRYGHVVSVGIVICFYDVSCPIGCRTGHGRLAGSGGLDGDGSP